jgi:hypothetical protein
VAEVVASPVFGFGFVAFVFWAFYLGRKYVIRYMKWTASLGRQVPESYFDDASVRKSMFFTLLAGAVGGTMGFIWALLDWIIS